MTTLSASQQAVVDSFPDFLMDDIREITISGFAGSGKTFLVQYLADMAGKQQELVQLIDPTIRPRTVYFTATTNKAASVLREMLQRSDVGTIHSLLGLQVRNDYSTGRQKLIQKDRVRNLSHSIIFIDEASMINHDLLTKVRAAIRKFDDCKVVYVGDSYQLPPVREDVCPVFKMGKNTLTLNEIQRQVEDSPIIQLSAEYREMLDNHKKPWPAIPADDKHIFHYQDKAKFFQEIVNSYVQPHEPDDLRILGWSNQRVRDYNRWIRHTLGKSGDYVPGEVVITNKPLFKDGAPIAPTDGKHVIENVTPVNVNTVDGYHIELRSCPGIEFFQPRDWKDADQLTKMFAREKAWGDYFNIKENWVDLRPVHASTVHKSQGSTFGKVFVDLSDIGKCNKWREVVRLIYVAITRTSDQVHIYGDITRNYNRKPLEDVMEAFANVDCL